MRIISQKITILSLIVILTSCTTTNNASFRGKSSGETMKRYLHHCTYDIWTGFREYIRYNFSIVDGVDYISISVEELPKTDKINEFIDNETAKHKAELKKLREDKYFGKVHRKNMKLGDNAAVFISYEFNGIHRKGESDFNDSLEIVEKCFIKLEDKTFVIKGHTFNQKYSKSVQKLWEEFYKSYRPDQSQAFKTNYGSFKWVPGLKDQSIIEYLAYDAKGNVEYTIDITYVENEDKEDVNEELSFFEKTVELLMNTAFVRKTRSEKINVNGHTIMYDEMSATINIGDAGKKADIRIFDFAPGVYIEAIETRPGNFDKYRNELDAMIKSIQFYPELKKD